MRLAPCNRFIVSLCGPIKINLIKTPPTITSDCNFMPGQKWNEIKSTVYLKYHRCDVEYFAYEMYNVNAICVFCCCAIFVQWIDWSFTGNSNKQTKIYKKYRRKRRNKKQKIKSNIMYNIDVNTHTKNIHTHIEKKKQHR